MRHLASFLTVSLAVLLVGCANESAKETNSAPAPERAPIDEPAMAREYASDDADDVQPLIAQPPVLMPPGTTADPARPMESLSAEVAARTAAPSEIADVPDRLPGGKDVVRVYYGTNRRPSADVKPEADPGDYYSSEQGPLEFGVVEVSVPWKHQRGHLETRKWYLFERDDAKKHFVLQRVVPTGESLFLRELNRDIAADPKREAFVFIHGFGTSFEAAAWRTGQLKADLDFDGPAIMYAWPSKGIVTPAHYFFDRDTVRDSRDELAQFLETVGTQTGANKIHVIAHSMGNYLLTPVLAQLRDRAYLPSPLFDQLILAAPDISAELFIEEIAPKLDRTARRTTIYATDHDYALRVSQMFNRTRRLGTLLGVRRGLESLPFVEIVDTDGAEFRLFEAGHSDYGGPILDDVRATIAGMKPVARGLFQHHLGPRHWAVAKAKVPPAITPVGYEVPAGSPSNMITPKQTSWWDTLTGWWPW